MKAVYRCFGIFIIMLIVGTAAYAEESIRITNGDWPPIFSEKMKYYGLGSHIVTEAFALEGVKTEYGFFPWERSYRMSEQGKWDGAIGWPYSEERAAGHYFSEKPIDKGECVFFYRKDMPFDWHTAEDLKKYKIGITLGDWILDGDDEITKALRDGTLKYERASKDELNFRKLAKGRIDIFPQHVDVGYAQMEEMLKNKELTPKDAELITHHSKPYRTMPLFLLLSKKHEGNKEMMERFNRGMNQLIESGKYDQFIEESRKGMYKE